MFKCLKNIQVLQKYSSPLKIFKSLKNHQVPKIPSSPKTTKTDTTLFTS